MRWFKLHLPIHQSGTIVCGFLAPTNQHDRDFAGALGWSVDGGTVLADRAYQTEELSDWLQEEADLLLITPKNSGQAHRPLVCRLRERVETTFSQLADRFIDRVRSRSFLGLWNVTNLKMLHYNLCQAGILSK